MATTDTAFTGSIPAIYDRHLAPWLFDDYALEVANRAKALAPKRILETAAGTGIVTEQLARALPDSEIVATDLNQAMLDMAAGRVSAANVEYCKADAQDLPFDDHSFDLVVCQFGIMFYPDKVKGNSEARRVLREGGRYLAVIWDGIDRNPVAKEIEQAVGTVFPDDPPTFASRTPWGYGDKARIEADLRSAGFSDVVIETIEVTNPLDARGAAVGLTQGSPLRAEIEARDPALLEQATDAAARALGRFDGQDTTLSAHIVTAVR